MRQLIAHSYKLAAVLLLVAFVGCAMTPAVPLTQEQQANVSMKTAEDSFMAVYRSAHDYVLVNPQHKDRWNTVIQPLFSNAHKVLMLYEDSLMGGQMTQQQLDTLIDKITADAITAMVAIGWIRPRR